MLVNALFTDAIWRDMAPVELMPPVSVMVQAFVNLVLRGIGYVGPLPDAPLMVHPCATMSTKES